MKYRVYFQKETVEFSYMDIEAEHPSLALETAEDLIKSGLELKTIDTKVVG